MNNVSIVVFDNYKRDGMKTFVVCREREHEDKGCGYGEGLPMQHHEEMTNFCFSFPPALHSPISLSLSLQSSKIPAWKQ